MGTALQKRNKPTRKLVERMLPGDSFLAEKVHHGISEVPMHLVYPHLNLVEAFAFGAGAWDAHRREEMRRSIRTDPHDLYSVFRIGFNSGMRIVTGSEDLVLRKDPLYRSLNPFTGTSFSDRIARVADETKEKFGEAILENATHYVFEGPYHRSSRSYHDGGKLQIMRFQASWPRKGQGEKIRERYITEINRIARSWDSEYTPFVAQKRPVPVLKPSTRPVHQPLLFS